MKRISVLCSMFKEHLRKENSMSKSQFIKLSGLVFIAGSFAFIAMLGGSFGSPIISSILLATDWKSSNGETA